MGGYLNLLFEVTATLMSLSYIIGTKEQFYNKF